MSNEELYTCMAPKLKFNKNTVDSFVSMGKIIRPKHIVICDQTFILP